MRRSETFTFRVSEEEKRLIAELAHEFQRSQSDMIRYLVVTISRDLEIKKHQDAQCREEKQHRS